MDSHEANASALARSFVAQPKSNFNVKQHEFQAQKSIANDDVAMWRKRAMRGELGCLSQAPPLVPLTLVKENSATQFHHTGWHLALQ